MVEPDDYATKDKQGWLNVKLEDEPEAYNYAYLDRDLRDPKKSEKKIYDISKYQLWRSQRLQIRYFLKEKSRRSMEKIDLSKALAFAIRNAGKATREDLSRNASIISFLHEVEKTSLGAEERRCCQQLPMVHVHIKKISKETKKLIRSLKHVAMTSIFKKEST
ncbi:unnamed protein product [Brassica napus]|uniref:(rape) hypothetical protein n=1 Tax=Brassica napus TaxID=3708 RepID=A0A816JVK6_BRANA|nr:unnamed protein product [Brassica napus]